MDPQVNSVVGLQASSSTASSLLLPSSLLMLSSPTMQAQHITLRLNPLCGVDDRWVRWPQRVDPVQAADQAFQLKHLLRTNDWQARHQQDAHHPPALCINRTRLARQREGRATQQLQRNCRPSVWRPVGQLSPWLYGCLVRQLKGELRSPADQNSVDHLYGDL